ncbi:hypothetical protein NSS79_10560 [Paenibacillus sp. FSL L8-0436]|uniref:hypothetical protein n=1 Tax=Paenibacillus sp. FSL L8-0436 TaxID=2954686 RepID=UPI0031582264
MGKTTKYLRCHTAVSGRYAVGDRFEVISEDKRCYYVAELVGGYTKEPDSDGDSFATWFTLETDAETAPITLLPDESLGGTLREYREVKRKAAVGELVKSCVDTPPVFTVTGTDDIETGSVSGGADGIPTWHKNYVVLEPTEILVINNERFRTVDRKAALGERVIMTKSGVAFPAGSVITVHPDADIREGIICYVDGVCGTGGGRYRVLEPVVSADSTPEPTLLSDQPAEDQAAANIVTLTLKVAELETQLKALTEWHRRAAIDLRVAREDIVLIEEGVSDELDALKLRITALESAPAKCKVASGPADTTPPSFSKSPSTADAYADLAAKMFAAPLVKSAQQIRDEIVERAKADVERIIDECWAAVRL